MRFSNLISGVITRWPMVTTGLTLRMRTCGIEGADIVVTFDADGQQRAADIAILVAALRAHGAEFVLGSRFLGRSLNQPRSRRILLKLATLFTRLTTGLSVTDTHMACAP